MNEKKIIRKPRIKTKVMNIRITEKLSQWLKEMNYSPTAIMHEACKDLGFKEE